jgi:hypothetical protein
MARPDLQDERDEHLQQPSLWGRMQVFYEQHTRAVTTGIIALLIGGTTLGIVSYRETARKTRSMQEACAAASILELEALQTKYPDSEAAPIILFRLARMYQEQGEEADLKKAKELYGKFGDLYPKHELSDPAGEALEGIMRDQDFLGAKHLEIELAHTLTTHPVLTSMRAAEEKNFDEEERMTPQQLPDPLVLVISGSVHITLSLFFEEAPLVAAGFLNDANIKAFDGTPLEAAADAPRRYKLARGTPPPRPSTFEIAKNERPLDAGSLAIELGADGKPILGAYYIFDDTPAALAPVKDRFLVFGRVSSALTELKNLTAESKVTSTVTEHLRDAPTPRDE